MAGTVPGGPSRGRRELPADQGRQLVEENCDPVHPVLGDSRLEERPTGVRLPAEHAAAPATGLCPDDVVARMGGEAAVLGVISDAPPQLVETDESRGVQAGDEIVVATRRRRPDRLHGAI